MSAEGKGGLFHKDDGRRGAGNPAEPRELEEEAFDGCEDLKAETGNDAERSFRHLSLPILRPSITDSGTTVYRNNERVRG